jgi:hypothetical protein
MEVLPNRTADRPNQRYNLNPPETVTRRAELISVDIERSKLAGWDQV